MSLCFILLRCRLLERPWTCRGASELFKICRKKQTDIVEIGKRKQRKLCKFSKKSQKSRCTHLGKRAEEFRHRSPTAFDPFPNNVGNNGGRRDENHDHPENGDCHQSKEHGTELFRIYPDKCSGRKRMLLWGRQRSRQGVRIYLQIDFRVDGGESEVRQIGDDMWEDVNPRNMHGFDCKLKKIMELFQTNWGDMAFIFPSKFY